MITLITNGNLPFPHICLLCGSNRKPTFNFPVTQDWSGAMLICVECLTSVLVEHGEYLGFVPKLQLDNANKLKRLASEKLSNFDLSLTSFREALDDAVNSFNNSLIAPVGSSYDGSSSTLPEIIQAT